MLAQESSNNITSFPMQFTVAVQLEFKTVMAGALTEYCAQYPADCKAEDANKYEYSRPTILAIRIILSLPLQRRADFVVQVNDVKIANIGETDDGLVTFLLYVLVNNGAQVLSQESLENAIKVLAALGFSGYVHVASPIKALLEPKFSSLGETFVSCIRTNLVEH